MNESPILRRVIENPFGAARDPAKQPPAAAPSLQSGLQRPARALESPSSTQSPAAAAVKRPSHALGDTPWRPTLNSGTDRTGAPVYDNSSVQRLLDQRPDIPRPREGGLTRPDFRNVRTGSSLAQVAATTPVLRPQVNEAGPYGAPAVARPLEPPPVIARPSAAPEAYQATRRAVADQRELTRDTRAMGAEILNPMSADAELLRRLENSQNSYFNKGSPQARRIIGEAIAGQMGARSGAAAQGQQQAGQAINPGVALEAGADEGAASRRLAADTFNVDAGYRDRALAEQSATRRAEMERPSLQTDAAGRLLRVTGSTAAPVMGADGAPVNVARPVTARDHQAEADDKMLAELLGLQKDSMGEFPADALATARSQLDQIRGGQRGASEQRVPTTGDVLDGYRFRGGDPSDPTNWEAQ